MISGRINKELKEICLLDQVYVKAEDGKQSVAKYVAASCKSKWCKRSPSKASFVTRPVKVSKRKKKILQQKLQNRWECNFHNMSK